MNQESIVLLMLFYLVASTFGVTYEMRKQRSYLRSLDIKLDALLKNQEIEWPALSPGVQALALDPSTKIAAIKRLREEKPGLGLAEAKAEVEAFAAKKH